MPEILVHSTAIVRQTQAGLKSERHGGERGDEVQCLIAAGVEDERLRARKEIQEPDVERRCKVCVLFPMRGEAGEVRPFGGDADGFPIEVRRRQRMQCEGQPVGDEQTGGDHPRRARAGEGDEEKERIAEPDLREHIGKDPVGLLALGRREKHREQHEQHRTPDGVTKHPPECFTTRLTVRDRPWERDTDHKHERRLNEIPQRASAPRDVITMEPYEAPNGAIGKVPGNLRKPEPGGRHEQHDGAAKGIE